MDTVLKLDEIELARYSPYETFSEFGMGFDDYMLGATQGLWIDRCPDTDSVGAQAYERGAECAMKRHMTAIRRRQRAAA